MGNGLMLAGARLTVLDLSDNAVGPVGMDGLHVLLTSPVCYTLQRLLLNNNGWGPTGGVVSGEARGGGDGGGRYCVHTVIAE